MYKNTENIMREYVDRTGQLFENFGFSRISGEMAALLYLYKGEMSLDEIAEFLDVSKGSVSINARFLLRMKYIKPVRVSGDRKDYYEFSGDLWLTLEESLESFIRTQIDDFRHMNEIYLKKLESRQGADKNDQIQRKHMLIQLNALNRFYQYMDVLRLVMDTLRVMSITKVIKALKGFKKSK